MVPNNSILVDLYNTATKYFSSCETNRLPWPRGMLVIPPFYRGTEYHFRMVTITSENEERRMAQAKNCKTRIDQKHEVCSCVNQGKWKGVSMGWHLSLCDIHHGQRGLRPKAMLKLRGLKHQIHRSTFIKDLPAGHLS